MSVVGHCGGMAWSDRQSPGSRHARPSGPIRSMAALCDTHRGTVTPLACISSRAKRKKWVWTISSSKTMRTEGRVPWSSVGR